MVSKIETELELRLLVQVQASPVAGTVQSQTTQERGLSSYFRSRTNMMTATPLSIL